MDVLDKEYLELVKELDQLARDTKGPESHVVKAFSYQIKATGDLDNQIEVLNRSIKALNHSTTRLMNRQIMLIVIQTIIAVLLALVALRLT